MIECLAHAVDAEVVMSARYRWILAHDEPPLIGYDQDLWVDTTPRRASTRIRRSSFSSSEPLRVANVALWDAILRGGSGPRRHACRTRAGELRPLLPHARGTRSVPPGTGRRALEAVSPEELSGRVGDGWYADLMQRSDAHPGSRMGVSRSLRLFRG